MMTGNIKHLESTNSDVALICGAESISYEELEIRANRLAHYLRDKGVVADTLVAICVERSFDMVVGILGILKAGGAYVPLDPKYPIERISYMLEDAKVSNILTQERLVSTLPNHEAEVFCFDRDWPEVEIYQDSNPESLAGPQNLAYCIYTSGSTGKPKGVMVTRQGLENMVSNLSEVFRISMDDRVFQFASLSFDAASAEILYTLNKRATLVIRDDNEGYSVEAVIDFINKFEITNVILPPTVLSALDPSMVPTLRTVISAGETCTETVLRKWASQVYLINGYGPSEATVCASFFHCPPDYHKIPPIGRPISNTLIYILDDKLNPVQIGVKGEIYISGVGLARGYLNRPDLTAEKFIPDPFSNNPGSRMYKTGDLGKYLPDNNIEYLGRVDQQVKVRGFRIELGEIESILSLQLGVREAVVIVREDASGDKNLVAYIVMQENAKPSIDMLRVGLMKQLPEYMIPAAYVFLDVMPLSHNGKIDRKALPENESIRPELADEYIAPRNAAEEMMSKIWVEVLNVDRVGIYDNFYFLGGDSLKAAQIANRINQGANLSIKPSEILQHQTIDKLNYKFLKLIDVNEKQNKESVINREEVERQQIFPLSCAQEQVFFVEQLIPGNRAYQAYAAIRIKGVLNVSALEKALSYLVERHEILRSTFHSSNDEFYGMIHQSWAIELPVSDLSKTPISFQEQQLEKMIDIELSKLFDYSKLPLIRWVLYRLSDTEHVLLQSEHHFVHDGWSFRLFIKELGESYSAICSNRKPVLVKQKLQFSDYCVRQREWLKSDEVEDLGNKWREYLTGVDHVLELPFSKDRPKKLSLQGKVHRESIDAKQCELIEKLSNSLGLSMFQFMYAIFGLLLNRYIGNSKFIIGTSLANRNSQDMESIIGMIVNIVPVVVNINEKCSVKSYFEDVVKSLVWSMEHGELPFVNIVKAVQPNRNGNILPLIQIAFHFHNSMSKDVTFDSLEIDILEALSNNSSKFDLNVTTVPASKNDDLVMLWEYNSDLFTEKTIQWMVGHYMILMKSVIDNPNAMIAELSLLTKSERHQQLFEWCNYQTHDLNDRRIHHLFEMNVDKNPSAIAVSCDNEAISYSELNSRANCLANYLLESGVSAGSYVPICFERSIDMIVTILGVLKAGCAYVPLDPYYPSERILYILKDVNASLVLTQKNIAKKFMGYEKSVICTDIEWKKISCSSNVNPSADAKNDTVAYVIYTSGTTGKPKGVLIHHSNVVRLFETSENIFNFDENDTWTLFHSYAFDFSVWEIWGALIYGGKLVVVPYIVSRSPEEFYELLVRKKITVLNQTPSAFRYLMQVDEQYHSVSDLRLRYIIFGGESLNFEILKPWLDQHGIDSPVLVNMYGITEITVHATYHRLTAEDIASGQNIIGRPLPDLQVYILDKYLQPVPIGIPGELYIGGPGVAQGYLNNDDLTAEKFIENHFDDNKNTKIYKSGDLARYRENGDIEYLGRIDTQVKIHGYRIELGEIENEFLRIEGVRESVVVVIDELSPNRYLKAFLVLNRKINNKTVAIDKIRKELVKKLPIFMVPTEFDILDDMPINQNGKIDRVKLVNTVKISNANYPVKNITSDRDSDKLKDVLMLLNEIMPSIDIAPDDDIFLKGFQSIMLMRFVARCKVEFGVDIKIHEIYSLSNPIAIAENINQMLGLS